MAESGISIDNALDTITGFLAQYWGIILFVIVLIILLKIKHKIKKALFLAILIGAALFASGVTFFNFQ
ncbi:MAG: hypothetical protein J6X85_04155 [Ruminococcus sp.]|nr:hypothetical protein [Ruminococcus sp.]